MCEAKKKSKSKLFDCSFESVAIGTDFQGHKPSVRMKANGRNKGAILIDLVTTSPMTLLSLLSSSEAAAAAIALKWGKVPHVRKSV